MSDIYKQFDAAFSNVSAFVIVKEGQRVATIAFKFPRDGAGRLYAYVHWTGSQMVRGYAGGYGYDKKTAAASVAAHKLPFPYQMSDVMADNYVSPDTAPTYDAFRYALQRDGGENWDSALRKAGFEVWQAV